jgi:hypothetical protein
MSGNGWHRQEQAIAALLQSSSITAASRVCGVSSRTFTRWLQQDAFRDRLRKAKAQLLEDAIDDLRQESKGFVRVLVDVAHDSISPPSARVSAAKAGLQIAIDAGHLQDLMNRLDELEQITVNAKPEWKGSSYEVPMPSQIDSQD